MELLSIIRQTENEELTTVTQKFVCTYPEQIKPIASEICQHLVGIVLLLEGNVIFLILNIVHLFHKYINAFVC